MGLFDKFKKKKKEDLPLIARVNLVELQKEREKNMQLGEKSILAYDYSKYFPRIRLYYVSFEKFDSRELGLSCLGSTFGVSSPFVLPYGMTVEEACKVVSYLSSKVEEENDIEPASQKSVSLVSDILSKYGFSKCEGYAHGHIHTVCDYDPHDIIETTFSNQEYKPNQKGITDLYSVGGDFRLFKKSEFYPAYFNWFTKDVTKEEVEKIYNRIGKEYLLEEAESSEK